MSDGLKKDYTKDENVLAYIGEMQRTSSKGTQPITWTPEVIRDLMRARAEARRRKRIWEEWAIKKYGGVGIAYNLPNVKFTKVDDMFREEWIKLRPEMSTLSIWTLVSYARKFDNLKKQLIEANGGIKDERSVDAAEEAVAAKPADPFVFYPESSVPMFDLDKVEAIPDIPQELKDLLRTRQAAKERQMEEANSKLSLVHLWQETWRQLHPHSALSGHEIQRLLFRYEQNPLVRARTAPARLRRSETEAGSDSPMPQPDEVIAVKPRNLIFPESLDEEEVSVMCYQTVFEARGATRKEWISLERDLLRPNHPVFEIPAVTGKPVSGSGTSHRVRWPAKGYCVMEKTPTALPKLTFSGEEGKKEKSTLYYFLFVDCRRPIGRLFILGIF
jgi:hypothetical protein